MICIMYFAALVGVNGVNLDQMNVSLPYEKKEKNKKQKQRKIKKPTGT